MSETPVYIELTATVVPLEPFRDVFIAQLGELGFDTFTDTEDGFQAYILKDQFSSMPSPRPFNGTVFRSLIPCKKSSK